MCLLPSFLVRSNLCKLLNSVRSLLSPCPSKMSVSSLNSSALLCWQRNFASIPMLFTLVQFLLRLSVTKPFPTFISFPDLKYPASSSPPIRKISSNPIFKENLQIRSKKTKKKVKPHSCVSLRFNIYKLLFWLSLTLNLLLSLPLLPSPPLSSPLLLLNYPLLFLLPKPPPTSPLPPPSTRNRIYQSKRVIVIWNRNSINSSLAKLLLHQYIFLPISLSLSLSLYKYIFLFFPNLTFPPPPSTRQQGTLSKLLNGSFLSFRGRKKCGNKTAAKKSFRKTFPLPYNFADFWMHNYQK